MHICMIRQPKSKGMATGNCKPLQVQTSLLQAFPLLYIKRTFIRLGSLAAKSLTKILLEMQSLRTQTKKQVCFEKLKNDLHYILEDFRI